MDTAGVEGGHRRSASWLSPISRLARLRDQVAERVGVPGLLMLAATLDLAGVLATDPGPRGNGSSWFWWVITAWALWRTYRGGATALRVARALFALGVFSGLLVLLPGFSAGDGQHWWWYPLVLATQTWNLAAVTSAPVRDWCSLTPLRNGLGSPVG